MPRSVKKRANCLCKKPKRALDGRPPADLKRGAAPRRDDQKKAAKATQKPKMQRCKKAQILAPPENS
jgi:hypothetical protein